MNGNASAKDMEHASRKALIADRYEIRQAIGSGGSGAVFQAWDTQLQRFVAVKRWNAPEPLLDDPEGTERLWREAMTLAAIQHPNILTIHDFGVDDEGPYVITEFVDGETLESAVRRGPFDREAFAEAAQQILEALIAAHQVNLIHRDLKPQNIMRTRLASGAWQYKILDFGLARLAVCEQLANCRRFAAQLVHALIDHGALVSPRAPTGGVAGFLHASMIKRKGRESWGMEPFFCRWKRRPSSFWCE